jgi:hypothetical protein
MWHVFGPEAGTRGSVLGRWRARWAYMAHGGRLGVRQARWMRGACVGHMARGAGIYIRGVLLRSMKWVVRREVVRTNVPAPC